MQPVNENRIQTQVIPNRPRVSGQSETMSNSGRTPLRRNTGSLPEDLVTLSKERSASLSIKKAPSAPVNPSESRALRDSFSTYA